MLDSQNKNTIKIVVLVLLLALVGTIIYRTFFISDDIPRPVEKVLPTEVEEVTEVIPEEVVQEIPKQEPKVVQKTPLYPGVYTVTDHETLSQIGLKIYENKNYWSLILQANSKRISNPDIIKRGLELTIPNINKAAELHSAHLLAYKRYLSVDKMSKSFWVLCDGSNFMGKDFHKILKSKLGAYEYKIIKRCSQR